MIDLRKEGALERHDIFVVTSFGMDIAGQSIMSDPEDSRLKLKWMLGEKWIVQYIPMIRVETNLGMEYYRWYFTDDNERKEKFLIAYFDGKRFVPRKNLQDAHYNSQLKSHSDKEWDSTFIEPFRSMERLEKLLEIKHLKTHYRGKPTERVKKILKEMAKLGL